MEEASLLEGGRVRSERLLEIGRNDSLVPDLLPWPSPATNRGQAHTEVLTLLEQSQ